MAKKIEKLILLDTDVISHFISGGQFAILPSLFPYKKVLLDLVANELSASYKFKDYINNVINSGIIKEISFQGDKQITMEYAKLIKNFGRGESACMAYCRFNNDILASSNIKDIAIYCETNGIAYLTTMDFLVEALDSKKLTEKECDDFITKVKAKGSKLPVNSISEYLSKYKIRKV
jgi:hypothetical protein